MSYSRYSRDDRYYDDPRTGRRRSSRPQDVSYSELQRIRQREMESMLQSTKDQDQDFSPVKRSRTQGDEVYPGNAYDRTSRSMSRPSQNDENDGYDNQRSRRRRDSAPDYGDVGRSRRSRRRRERDTQDDNQNQQQQQQSQQERRRQQQAPPHPDHDESGERRLFDKGSDGLITAAAGAAMGAITARHFAGPKDFSRAEQTPKGRYARNWKMIAGAVAGAAAFNMGEQAFKTYFEEQAEHMEDMQTGGEFVGEMIGAAAPDVL
jgi:hypothetical protein